MPYQRLHEDKVVDTVYKLCQRIDERFPDSGLSKVGTKLFEISKTAQARSAWVAEPIKPLRIAIALTVCLLVVLLCLAVYSVVRPVGELSLVDFMQAVEAGTNDLILLGAAIFSLVTLETRIKRHRALKALHELRVIAHIVDMHQLTKDPETILGKGPHTASSPTAKRDYTGFELSRYLDYCTELLSLCGKIAVLYVQEFDDQVVLDAVKDIESLANGLSQKIWQKLVILNSLR